MFLLVHGAFHGAWCWERIVPELAKLGHTGLPIDLPGHGADPTPIAGVSLEANAERIVCHLRAATEPVVLVSHSLGGMPATQAAAIEPDKVAQLIYVTALVPADGQRMADLPQRADDDPVGNYLLHDEPAGVFTFLRERARETMYGRCDELVAASAVARLEPESRRAAAGRVRLRFDPLASIPAAYVQCLYDRAISIERQRAICRARSVQLIRMLDADHSPFLSRPVGLARHLADLWEAVTPDDDVVAERIRS